MRMHLMTEILLRSFLLPLSAILLLQQDNISFAFAPTTTRTTVFYKKYHYSSQTIHPLLPALSVDNNNNNDDDDDNAWQNALQNRLHTILQKKSETRTRWLNAEFHQTLLGTPDWVRRVSLQWPLAVCGTSSGDIYVIQCETGVVLGKGRSMQDQRRYADVDLSSLGLREVLTQLYGEFDGGGTLGIGLSWTNCIAHAGRNGGVDFWRIDTDRFDDEEEEEEPYDLISQGSLLEDVLVTCLDWAKDDLWIGTQDGRVLVYTIDNDDDDELPSKPVQEFNNLGGGAIFSIKYNEELDVAAATTSSGLVELLSMEEPDCRRSFNPPFDSGRMSSNVFPLCAMIVEEELGEEEEEAPNVSSSSNNKRKFSLACGGNDGSVFLKSLQLLDNTIDPELDLTSPFSTDSTVRALVPGHQGPCKCLESPFPGMLLSGGQDGTVRVWEFNADTDDDETSANGKYILGGFKVWLGSFCTDGERLVMDGADNAISVLDFGGGGGDS